MLHLEKEILDRLRGAAVIPPDVRVFSAADLAGAAQNFQFSPAVHVVFSGYRVRRNTANNFVAEVEQTWLTVAAARSARDQQGGGAARGGASELTEALFGLMAGWLPGGACAPFALADAPGASFDQGVFYIPMAWRTVVELCRDAEDGFPLLKRVTAVHGIGETQEIPAEETAA